MSHVPDPGNTEPPKQPKEARFLKLSQIEAFSLNTKDPYLIIQWDRKTGFTTRRGSTLIADIGEAQNEGRSPAFLMLAESQTITGELLGVPTSKESADALKITWRERGQKALIKADKLLALRNAAIPEGTRMFISLYETVDSDFGKVVGIRINSATFQPINFLTEEEKEALAQKRAEKEKDKQAKAKAKEEEQDQAVAELPTGEAAEDESEVE